MNSSSRGQIVKIALNNVGHLIGTAATKDGRISRWKKKVVVFCLHCYFYISALVWLSISGWSLLWCLVQKYKCTIVPWRWRDGMESQHEHAIRCNWNFILAQIFTKTHLRSTSLNSDRIFGRKLACDKKKDAAERETRDFECTQAHTANVSIFCKLAVTVFTDGWNLLPQILLAIRTPSDLISTEIPTAAFVFLKWTSCLCNITKQMDAVSFKLGTTVWLLFVMDVALPEKWSPEVKSYYLTTIKKILSS